MGFIIFLLNLIQVKEDRMFPQPCTALWFSHVKKNKPSEGTTSFVKV